MGIDLGVALGAGVEQYNRMRSEDRADKALKFQESAEARAQKDFDNKQQREERLKEANSEYYESLKDPITHVGKLNNSDVGMFGAGEFKGKDIRATSLPGGKTRVSAFDRATGEQVGFKDYGADELSSAASNMLTKNHLARLASIDPALMPQALSHGISREAIDLHRQTAAEASRHGKASEKLATDTLDFHKTDAVEKNKIQAMLARAQASSMLANINPLNTLTPEQNRTAGSILSNYTQAAGLNTSDPTQAAGLRQAAEQLLGKLPIRAQLELAQHRGNLNAIDPREVALQNDVSKKLVDHVATEPPKSAIPFYNGAEWNAWNKQKEALQAMSYKTELAAQKAPPLNKLASHASSESPRSLGLSQANRDMQDGQATYGLFSAGRLSYLDSEEKLGRHLTPKEEKEL